MFYISVWHKGKHHYYCGGYGSKFCTQKKDAKFFRTVDAAHEVFDELENTAFELTGASPVNEDEGSAYFRIYQIDPRKLGTVPSGRSFDDKKIRGL